MTFYVVFFVSKGSTVSLSLMRRNVAVAGVSQITMQDVASQILRGHMVLYNNHFSLIIRGSLNLVAFSSLKFTIILCMKNKNKIIIIIIILCMQKGNNKWILYGTDLLLSIQGVRKNFYGQIQNLYHLEG